MLPNDYSLFIADEDGDFGVVVDMQIPVGFKYGDRLVPKFGAILKGGHVAQASQAQLNLPNDLHALVFIDFQIIGAEKQVAEFNELLPDFLLFCDDVIAVFGWICRGKSHLCGGFCRTRNAKIQEGPEEVDM